MLTQRGQRIRGIVPTARHCHDQFDCGGLLLHAWRRRLPMSPGSPAVSPRRSTNISSTRDMPTWPPCSRMKLPTQKDARPGESHQPPRTVDLVLSSRVKNSREDHNVAPQSSAQPAIRALRCVPHGIVRSAGIYSLASANRLYTSAGTSMATSLPRLVITKICPFSTSSRIWPKWRRSTVMLIRGND